MEPLLAVALPNRSGCSVWRAPATPPRPQRSDVRLLKLALPLCGWLLGAGLPATSFASPAHPWLSAGARPTRTLSDIPPPAGAARDPQAQGSFGAWLRGLPLRPEGTPVKLHNGRPKWTQKVHHAVVDLDLIPGDLQQCADAVMRLRAEYLWAARKPDSIGFHLTNGMWVPWSRWSAGQKVVVTGGRNTRWVAGRRSGSREAFRRYLRFIMLYAGTASMSKEMRQGKLSALEAGDVLVQGGHPGHAVLILDTATAAQGERWMLLGQSYMPAQDFHVLRNPGQPQRSPWFPVAALQSGLQTPEWGPFRAADLRTFRGGVRARR